MNQELHTSTFERFLSGRDYRSTDRDSREIRLPLLEPEHAGAAPSTTPVSKSSRSNKPSAGERRSSATPRIAERQRQSQTQPHPTGDSRNRSSRSPVNMSGTNVNRRNAPAPPSPMWTQASAAGVKKIQPSVYQCEYCQMKFGRKHHKERHVDNLHRRSTGPSCPICGISFHQKPNLFRHMQLVHEVLPYQCDICGSGFSRRAALKRHHQNRHRPRSTSVQYPSH